MASASVILLFPQRNKGRIRHSASLQSGGEMVLQWMERHGEETPSEIARPWKPEPVECSQEMCLAVAIFCALDRDTKDAAIGHLSMLKERGVESARTVLDRLRGQA
jgi:hypothetical protein